MASSCNIDDKDTNPAKKMKFSANEDTHKLRNDIVADHGGGSRYYVQVAFELVNAHASSKESLKALYSSLMEDAGCSGSQISTVAKYCFFADLTEEEAKKLSAVDNVKHVRPQLYYCPEGSIAAKRYISQSSWHSSICR